MYHSITFGNKNTWDDWHLVPSSRPLFNPPAQKVKTLDIPGGDGVLDLSTALTGYPIYENRSGSIEFIVMNGYNAWQDAYSNIMDYLHGQTMQAILEDDPNYFYEGRFTVNAWKSDKYWSKITINYSVGPYKWANTAYTQTVSVTTGSTSITLASSLYDRAPVCPTFTVTAGSGTVVNARFINTHLGLDVTRTLSSGTHQVPEFVLFGDDGATLQMSTSSGSASVTLSFRKGRL